jgi:hypothetical protein
MTDCIVLRCPACERQRLCPAESATADKLHDRIAGHIVDHHPETSPDEAEGLIERALGDVEVARVDVGSGELGSWREDLP